MEEMALLKFLTQNRGASVYEVMEEFGIKRTAALYHLGELQDKSLIVLYKNGRSNLYFVPDSEKVHAYFESKITELQTDLLTLTATPERKNTILSKGGKLTLAFVNFKTAR